MTRTVVTGAHGFVARWLVDALVHRGDEVVGFDLGGDFPGIEYHRADLRDAAAVERLCRGADTVFHCASLVHTKRNREDDVRAVNIDGTHHVLTACRKARVKKLVYVSSASVVYEGHDVRAGDESLPYARRSPAPYAETKIVAERAVLAAHGVDGVSTCAIRPHVVFGPRDARFIPAILERARAGKLRFYVGDPKKLSDFTYVTNVVDALLAADERLGLETAVGGQAYFVTNGEPMGFWSFVEKVIQPLGYPAPKYGVPFPLAYGAATVREFIDTLRGGTLHQESGLSRFAIRYLCTDHYFSHAKATRDLDYRPRVSIDEGIQRTLEWLKTTPSFASTQAPP